MDMNEKEEYLLKKGWKPVIDNSESYENRLVGWIKEPSMQVYSTDLAYEKEQTDYELIIEFSCGGSKCS